MNLDDWLLILTRRARSRGQEQRLIQLITSGPEVARQVAAFLEAGERVEDLGKKLTAGSIEALTLCGLPLAWTRVRAEAVAGMETRVE